MKRFSNLALTTSSFFTIRGQRSGQCRTLVWHLRAKSYLIAKFSFPFLEFSIRILSTSIKIYLFRNEISAIVRYVGFLVVDLL